MNKWYLILSTRHNQTTIIPPLMANIHRYLHTNGFPIGVHTCDWLTFTPRVPSGWGCLCETTCGDCSLPHSCATFNDGVAFVSVGMYLQQMLFYRSGQNLNVCGRTNSAFIWFKWLWQNNVLSNYVPVFMRNNVSVYEQCVSFLPIVHPQSNFSHCTSSQCLVAGVYR